MSFTPEEKQQWREERQSRKATETQASCSSVMSRICLHCGNESPPSEGVETVDAFICDTCND